MANDSDEEQNTSMQGTLDWKKILEWTHNLALKGPTIAMLTLGATIIVAVTAGRITPVIHVDPDTYNTSMVVGVLLLVFASVIRVYEFKVQTGIERELRQSSVQTLKAQQGAALANQKIGIGKASGL
jgi:hypothetical protein